LRHFQGTGVGTWGLLSAYGARAFAAGPGAVREHRPDEWLGVLTVPLGRYRYDRLSHDRARAREQGRWYTTAPYERTFEKLCFRNRFDPAAQYLVLQGLQGLEADNVPPRDANSIIRYTDNGHVWLIANTDRQGNFYRNAVYVSDGTNAEPQPAACEAAAVADFGHVAMTATRLPDYSGGDWTRHIFWLKGKYFAVVDTVRLQRDGQFAVFCTWRTPVAAALSGKAWEACDAEYLFRLVNADGVKQTSGREGLEGAANPTVLRQVQTVRGRSGDHVMFRNVFRVVRAGRRSGFDARAIGEHCLMTDAGARRDLLGVNPGTGVVRIGPFETNARMFYLTDAGESALVGGSYLEYRGERLRMVAGRVTLPSGARVDLARLWREAGEKARAGAAEADVRPAPAGARSASRRWFDALTPRLANVDNPIVMSDVPPAAGSLDDLVDGFIPLWSGDVSWPAGQSPVLTLDLRREYEVGAIEFATGLVSRPNTLPDASDMQARGATVEFSVDGFERDVRGQEVTFAPGFTIEPLHKGTVFAMGRWRAAGMNERARYVRLRLDGDAGRGVTMREVFIRAAGTNEARFGSAEVGDLDGDGQDELIVTTDACELVVVGAEGQERWRKSFAGAVTCARVVELAEASRVLLVGTWEARLYCFDADGIELWRTDFLPLGGDLPVPFSVAVWQPEADSPPQIIVGNYARVSFLDAAGRMLSHNFAYGSHETMTLAPGFDVTGDGVDDAILYNPWATLSVVDGAKREVVRWLPAPAGEGLALELWDDRGAADPRALVASENGLGMLRLKSGRYDWRADVTPLTCVAGADLDGDGAREIVVGKRGGFLLVYSEAGELRQRVLLGEAVMALQVIELAGREAGGTAGLLVATDEALRMFEAGADGADGAPGPNLSLQERGVVSGRGYVDLRRLRGEGEETVVVGFAPGLSVEAFDVSRGSTIRHARE
ncbi:MAG: PQQ-binding-like beta-propeller repeat protein, partial [Armatimonadota bacterium]